MPTSQRRRTAVRIAAIVLVLSTTMSHYTVKPGDTLSEIAADNGISVADILATNQLSNPDLIVVGQVLDVHSSANAATSPPPLSPTSITHLVAPGESLASIASRYSTTSAALMALNGITNPNLIFAGTLLIIQGTVPVNLPSVGATGSGTHTVKAGDTLSEIAVQYGVSVGDLVTANGLGNADMIRIGQQLVIPGGGSGFVCPVPGSTFFNDYGFPRSGGRYHEGNDLFAARGTPVLAPVSGFAHHLVGDIGGKQFRLDGDDGHRYIGSHLDSFGVSGEVEAGDVIGFVGDSGNALGSSPHLHFEIHLDRTDVTNPFPILDAACN